MIRFDTLMTLITDAACVARHKGWATVTIAKNQDGRWGLFHEVML